MPEPLERQLRALAADVAWPATPDLAATVGARLGEPEARARRRAPVRRRRRLVVALAAALLLLPATALALPGPRHAILDALGLRHVRVERRARPGAGHAPRLGERTTPAAASRRAGFTATWPLALGRPDRAYVLGGVVSYVYDRPHLLLAQARGRLQSGIVLEKILSIDAAARRVEVAGRPGIWLSRPHLYAWSDATGPPVRSGSALVWERAGRVLRLEGARSRAEAVRIAASVR